MRLALRIIAESFIEVLKDLLCFSTHTLWNSRIDEIRLIILCGLGGRFSGPFRNGGFGRVLKVKDPVHSCSTDAVLPGDLADGLPATTVPADGITIKLERRPSDVPALQARPPHAAADALDDQ